MYSGRMRQTTQKIIVRNHESSLLFSGDPFRLEIPKKAPKKITVAYRIHPQYNTAADSFPTKFHSFPQITHLQFNHQTCIYLPATAKGTTTYSCCWVGSLNRTLFRDMYLKIAGRVTHTMEYHSLQRGVRSTFSELTFFFRNGFSIPYFVIPMRAFQPFNFGGLLLKTCPIYSN